MFKQGVWQHETGFIITVKSGVVYASTDIPLAIRTKDIFDCSKWKKVKKEVRNNG